MESKQDLIKKIQEVLVKPSSNSSAEDIADFIIQREKKTIKKFNPYDLSDKNYPAKRNINQWNGFP